MADFFGEVATIFFGMYIHGNMGRVFFFVEWYRQNSATKLERFHFENKNIYNEVILWTKRGRPPLLQIWQNDHVPLNQEEKKQLNIQEK